MGRIHQLAISDDGFVFDPATGQSYTVSASGLLILNALRQGGSTEQIVHDLVDAYEVPADEAAQDVQDFLMHLGTERLL